jgi:hypothetical protein
MKGYNCGHSHNSVMIHKRGNHDLYDEYIKWKYSVGFRGNCELCWNCYLTRTKYLNGDKNGNNTNDRF